MNSAGGRLSIQAFRQVVALAPLVAIDLLVLDAEGRMLIGRRTNPPAQGWWFAPGGRIRKNEIIQDAFGRITGDELGQQRSLAEASLLGAYDHHYAEDFTGAKDIGTHYVVLAYRLPASGTAASLPLEQHADYRWVHPLEGRADPGIHIHTRAYMNELSHARP